MNHFLSDSWDKARALKRGAGKVIALDPASAETKLGHLLAGLVSRAKWAYVLTLASCAFGVCRVAVRESPGVAALTLVLDGLVFVPVLLATDGSYS